MNNQKKILLIGITLVVMIALVWAFGGAETQEKKAKTKPPFVSSNWTKKYQLADKDPQGLYLFNELAKAHIDTAQKVAEVHSWSDLDTSRKYIETPKTFMFVGNVFAAYDRELDSLMEHIEEGSTLFMSFNDLREEMYDALFDYFEFEYDYTEDVNVFAGGKEYSMINIFQNDTVAYQWYAFGYIEPPTDYKVLSSFMELENFVEFPYGKGRVLLHANPNMFYNYQVKRKEGFGHTDFVLSQLDKNQDILHMEFGRASENFGDFEIEEEGSGGKVEDSYLRLIFQNQTLLFAWLLAFLALILFVIFRSKRTRPIVQYISPKKDMTLAFAETITSIYFSKRNPYGILQVMRRNFYNAVQRHFFVDLSRRSDDRAIETLAEKSNIEYRELVSLIEAIETKEPHQVNDNYLSSVQKRQQQFYKRVGIITDRLTEEISNRKVVIRRSLVLPGLLIFAGIFLIIMGMFFLTEGLGTGIVFWPLGIVMLTLGVLRISKPCLVIEGNEITHYGPLGIKKEYKADEILSVNASSNKASITFRENRSVNINYWDMSRFDRKQFEAYLSKMNTI